MSEVEGISALGRFLAGHCVSGIFMAIDTGLALAKLRMITPRLRTLCLEIHALDVVTGAAGRRITGAKTRKLALLHLRLVSQILFIRVYHPAQMSPDFPCGLHLALHLGKKIMLYMAIGTAWSHTKLILVMKSKLVLGIRNGMIVTPKTEFVGAGRRQTVVENHHTHDARYHTKRQ